MRHHLAVTIVLAVVFVASLACGGSDSSDGNATPSPAAAWWTVEEARAFEGFDLFWLGEEFEGHELNLIVRGVYDPRPPEPDQALSDQVVFVYGECEPGSNSEGSCTIPLSIGVQAYCTRPSGQVRGESLTARGASGVTTRDGDAVLYAGDVTIVVDTSNDGPPTETVIEMLEALDPKGIKAGEPFPPVSSETCPAVPTLLPLSFAG